DLPQRQHFWIRQQLTNAVEAGVRRLRRIVRMHPDRRVEKWIPIGQPDSRFQVRRTVARPDSHQPLDSRRPRPLDDGVPVRLKLLIIEMAMGVDKLHFNWVHFSRAPTGTSSRKPASTGLPPSR